MLSLLWPIPCAGCGSPGKVRLCADCHPTTAFTVDPPEMVHEVWAAAPYDGPVGRAVLRSKARGDRALAVALAQAIAPVLASSLTHIDRIVPVPSPWTRRLVRGFSLSSVLAEPLGQLLDAPVDHRALVARRGERQAALDAKARKHGLIGRIRSRTPVSGTVLVIDDVTTTGATASACARELLGAGAERVVLAVACAAVRDREA